MHDKIIRKKNINTIRVRYAETDAMGLVYNSEYLVYFEVARGELMRSIGYPYSEFEKAGYVLPLVEAHVNFKTPAHYDDLLEIHAQLIFEMKATLRIEYNIFRGNTTIAEGYTVHSFLNKNLNKPVKPPKIFVDKISAKSND